MEGITTEEMVRTCAIQAVRIEKQADQIRNLSAILEANNQQIIALVEEKNKLVQELEAEKAKNSLPCYPGCSKEA